VSMGLNASSCRVRGRSPVGVKRRSGGADVCFVPPVVGACLEPVRYPSCVGSKFCRRAGSASTLVGAGPRRCRRTLPGACAQRHASQWHPTPVRGEHFDCRVGLDQGVDARRCHQQRNQNGGSSRYPSFVMVALPELGVVDAFFVGRFSFSPHPSDRTPHPVLVVPARAEPHSSSAAILISGLAQVTDCHAPGRQVGRPPTWPRRAVNDRHLFHRAGASAQGVGGCLFLRWLPWVRRASRARPRFGRRAELDSPIRSRQVERGSEPGGGKGIRLSRAGSAAAERPIGHAGRDRPASRHGTPA
jgi:hypothetical protein